MIKLDFYDNSVRLFSKDKKDFIADKSLKIESIHKCVHFASEMAYGNGYHKSQSFGGNNYSRNPAEIFINTLQGKLAELAVFNQLFGLGIVPDKLPEFDVWGKGKWEDCDFTLNNGTIRCSVKSTKFFGNVLLLEKDKYNSKGEFLETESLKPELYDFTFLVRISGVKFAKPEKYLELNLNGIKIETEVTGFLSHRKFLEVISEKQIIKKGTIFGVPILVDNYYIAAKDLTDVKYLKI